MLEDDGQRFVVVRTPDNPTYWWGNTLHFDGPPRDGDLERWDRLFETHVEAYQPLSTHRTFGWDGSARGAIAPFVARGYEYFELLVLAAKASTPIVAPYPGSVARVAAISGAGWDALLDLLVDTRDPSKHMRDDYRVFAERRVSRWRSLVDAGRGAWLGARAGDEDDRLLSALGVFVEAEAGPDGRRIGRFQHVVTRVEARRRGIAGVLVAEAARFAFDALGADTLLIVADEHHDARRAYQAAGFVPAAMQRGLELGRA